MLHRFKEERVMKVQSNTLYSPNNHFLYAVYEKYDKYVSTNAHHNIVVLSSRRDALSHNIIAKYLRNLLT